MTTNLFTRERVNMRSKIITGKKRTAFFLCAVLLLATGLSFTGTVSGGTIGNINLNIGPDSGVTTLNVSTGQTINILTKAGTVIKVILEGASSMLPYGVLLSPDGTGEEWPATTTVQAGYNSAEKNFPSSGEYKFTGNDLNNSHGSIKITFEGKYADMEPPQEGSYQQGIEDGKKICLENPALCGINIPTNGYTESDLSAARNEGYQAGLNDCHDQQNGCSILDSNNYDIIMPCIDIFGTKVPITLERYINKDDPFWYYWKLKL